MDFDRVWVATINLLSIWRLDAAVILELATGYDERDPVPVWLRDVRHRLRYSSMGQG